MDNPDNKPNTLEERLIGAFISAVAMICTIAALSLVFFIISAKGRFAGVQLLSDFVFSRASLFIVAAAAVLGFFLSFDTMTTLFGSLWGTNTSHENASVSKFVIMVAFTVAIGSAFLLIRLN